MRALCHHTIPHRGAVASCCAPTISNCRLKKRNSRHRAGVSSDASQAPTADVAVQPAAVQPDPNLDSFKALIAEKRFICTQCGKCCTGAGEVWVIDAEASNIARYLNMPLKRFLTMHTHAYSKVEGFRLLRSNLDSETRDCTFLRPDNTCAIHPVRPLQCSTYPWWPELMDDKDWQWEKENVCEGFDHPDAPPTDLNAAATQLKQATVLEYQKRLAYKPSRKQNKKEAAAVLASSDSGPYNNSRGNEQLNSRPGGSVSSSKASSDGSMSHLQGRATARWQERLQKLQGMLDEVV